MALGLVELFRDIRLQGPGLSPSFCCAFALSSGSSLLELLTQPQASAPPKGRKGGGGGKSSPLARSGLSLRVKPFRKYPAENRCRHPPQTITRKSVCLPPVEFTPGAGLYSAVGSSVQLRA